MLEFFKLDDLVPLMLLIGLLECVGAQMENDPQTRWGARGTAAASFLLYAVAGITAWRPDTAWDFVELVMRAALAMGTAHGAARIVLPAVLFAYRKLRAEFAARRHKWAQEKAKRDGIDAGERAAADKEEAERRRRAEDERRRPEEEARARSNAEAQRRREDARAECETLYSLLAPDIGERFTRDMFKDFMGLYLHDGRPPEEVERRARQLLELLRQHHEKVQPPKGSSMVELAEWFQQQKAQIEALPVEDKFKRSYLAMLNARFQERMREQLEDMRQ